MRYHGLFPEWDLLADHAALSGTCVSDKFVWICPREDLRVRHREGKDGFEALRSVFDKSITKITTNHQLRANNDVFCWSLGTWFVSPKTNIPDSKTYQKVKLIPCVFLSPSTSIALHFTELRRKCILFRARWTRGWLHSDLNATNIIPATRCERNFAADKEAILFVNDDGTSPMKDWSSFGTITVLIQEGDVVWILARDYGLRYG